MGIKFTDVCFITEDVLKLRKFYEAILKCEAEGDGFCDPDGNNIVIRSWPKEVDA